MSISVKVESKHSSIQQAVPTTLEIEYTVSEPLMSMRLDMMNCYVDM